MELKMGNIGLIKEGTIEIEDITVIAGVNDSGKSTIGKVLYSIVKAGGNYEFEYNDYIINRLVQISKSCYRQLRKFVEFEYNQKQQIELSPVFFERSLRESDYSIIKITLSIDRYVENIRKIFIPVDRQSKSIIDKYLFEIRDLKQALQYGLSKNGLMGATLIKILNSEFKNDITSKYAQRASYIKLSEGKNEILRCEIIKNRLKYIELFDKIYLNDVTYIESSSVIKNAIDGQSDRNKDLIIKLMSSNFGYNDYNRQLEYLLNKKSKKKRYYEEKNYDIGISNIIKGKLEYSVDEKKFFFKKNSRIKFDIDNVASGVKAFGILDLLLEKNILVKDSLLIIDEPEVHLHPQWQIEYGRMICEISKMGVKVVISTHSPYIIESINYYNKKNKRKNSLKFYLTNKIEDNYTIVEDCTYDLNRIYKLLSEPIEKLVWGDYDA